ncbi:MAG: phosphoglycerate kinase [Phycisphaerae bacterium]
MNKRTIRDLNVRGKRVFVRADFNVPLDDHGNITDDRRITQFLPTLEHLVKSGARVMLASHLGRPTGDPAADKGLSLRPVAERIAKLTNRACAFVDNCIGPAVVDAASKLKDGETLLLENLRFHKGEDVIDKAKKNPDGKLTPEQDAKRQEFAKALSASAEMYVNDAFGTCHRKHVSMYDVPQVVGTGNRAIGFLVEKELEYLGKAVNTPKRPLVAVLGGAKVSDKIGVIKALLAKCDTILVGGAMMFTFWAAASRGVGKSLCERDKLDLARELMATAGGKLKLPVDCVVASELKAGVATQIVEGEVPAELMGLDIGPKTLAQFGDILNAAGTIVWNGPVGAFETKPFDKGTFALADLIAKATARGAVTVIGGGDSAAAVEQAGLAAKMSHISTGGGASLEFLEGKKFAALDVIDDA